MIDFIFLGSKITADSDCSHEIKRHLLLERKAMTNLDSLLKSETLLCQQRSVLVKAMAFLVVHVWIRELAIRKAEHRWTDAFELWCWRRLLRVPWTARRSNQSILKESSPEYSLLLNCGVGEDSWESLRLQEDQISQSWKKAVLNIHCKDWCWSWSSNTLATWCEEEEPTHWKRPWF